MAELLLELFSEEIPAGVQLNAANELKDSIKSRLETEGVACESIECYATPRRVVIAANGLPTTQNATTAERRGPRVDAPEQAIEGFVKSCGLAKDQLEKRSTDKGEFYFAVIKKEGRDVAEVISKTLQEILYSFTWPKSMRWGEYNIRWTRPLHNILCLFNGRILPITFGHLTANDKTYGHRFLSKGDFSVSSFEDYKQKLNDNFVVLSTEERKKLILEGAEQHAKSCGLALRNDEGLLNEVAGLVEWPVVLLGRIEEKFMAVPQEVLITSMRSHQKYFSLVNSHGHLAPYFITVANINADDGGAKIIAGNERVLRARLEDAKFFWDQDRRINLGDREAGLKKIIFHAKLGTVADKVNRIADLAKLLSVWIPRANLILVERAAKLCKADLTTQMVGEFPELQGLMGSYYAIESKEEHAVADAVKEHYSPVGPNDICPSAPLSIAVSLADKVDTLVGLFAIDEKPTGSRDPYALRRAALGVIRIILENNLRIPLRLLFEKSISKYPKALFKSEKSVRKLLPTRKKGEKPRDKQERVINDLLEFFADRLKVLLKEQSIGHDRIQAVFDGGNEDDLNRLVNRVKVLEAFLKTYDGANLLAAYKRAVNIVAAEEKKDDTVYSDEPDKGLLAEDEEKKLYELFAEVIPNVEDHLKKDEFEKVMADLAKLRKAVDNFFEKVTVNCENPATRKNRLLLLAQFRAALNEVADFSKIEG